MLKAPKPQNETERLAALSAFDLLDTPDEVEFDQITKLAAKICGVPISLISLVDSDRQWFKSRTNLEVKETHRDFAFCAHAILGTEPFIVNNASKDPRFADNPLVTAEPHVNFYAGVPLIDADGYALGTLCVLDHVPRELSESQLEMLKILAHQTLTQFQLRKSIFQKQLFVEHFKKLTSQVPGVIYQFRMLPDGKSFFPFASDALHEVYEYSPEELRWDASQTVSRLHPADRESTMSSMQQSRREMSDWKLDYRVILPKKGERWLRVRSRPEKLADGSVQWNGFIMDVTEEKRLEKSAQNNVKLLAMGEMAAGVAHEINNPLAIIQGASDFLMRSSELPENIRSKIESISKGTRRITKIISSLKKFSRQETVSQPIIVPLKNIVEEALTLTAPRAKKASVEMGVDLKSEANIYCDELEIEQVVVNLVNNAIDAASRQEQKWVKLLLFEKDDRLFLQVRDSGLGIPEDIREKIFHPFFTTKAVGEGTGLGLSIVRGIVESYGASIKILVDDPNTCFELQFSKR